MPNKYKFPAYKISDGTTSSHSAFYKIEENLTVTGITPINKNNPVTTFTIKESQLKSWMSLKDYDNIGLFELILEWLKTGYKY